MNANTMNRTPVLGSLAGRQLFCSRPVPRPSRSHGQVTVAAEALREKAKPVCVKENLEFEILAVVESKHSNTESITSLSCREHQAGSWTRYPGADAPEYLDGSLPGDRGFDPLRLFQNPNVRPWLVEGELYNGRVAMLAAAGILAAEAAGNGPWWDAPNRVSWPLPYFAGIVLFHFVYGSFELARFRNFQKYGETGLLNQVPFDPLGLRNDGARQKEVRNGRLAMLANLGFWSQAATTGKGPLQNLQDHLAEPFKVNIYTNPKVGFEATIAAIFIGIVPIILEARKDLTPEQKRKEEAGYRPFPFL